MRYQRFKHYLKFGILLFGISLFLFGCEKEETTTINQYNNETSKLEFRRIPLEDFEELNSNTKVYNKIFSNLDISNTNKRKSNSNEEKLIILTNEIVEVKKNNIITYTFRVKKTDFSSKDFQNLMIHRYSNDSVKLAIINYTYTGEKENFPYSVTYENISSEDLADYNNILNYASKQVVLGLGMIVDDCVSISYWCPAGGTNYHTTDICGAGTGTTEYFLDFSGCDLGGGGSGQSVGSGNDNNVGGTTGSNNDSGNTNPSGGSTGSSIDTNGGTGAILPEFGDFDDFFFNFLTPEQRDWINHIGQKIFKTQLENFLIDNNYSVESEEFAMLAIDAKLKGASVDFVDKIIIDPSFLNTKADCVFNKLLKTGVTNYHNMITELFIEFGEGNIGLDNITFKMSSNLPYNVGGKTSTDKKGNYYIEINSDLMNTLSSIEVAAILVHEISHAFLGKHYNNSYDTFKVIYQQYINDNGLANYSHDIMKDYFINRMANVLYNYDSTIFSNYEDYKILSSQGVYELSTDELRKLNDVKIKSRTNDTNCK